MDYESMWEELANKLEKVKTYYKNSNQELKQSIIDVVQQYMFEIEVEHETSDKILNSNYNKVLAKMCNQESVDIDNAIATLKNCKNKDLKKKYKKYIKSE